MPEYFTPPQIADRLGVRYATVYRAAAAGRLPALYHDSRFDCNPENPCHLEPGTQGHHYAITIDDAGQWAKVRSLHFSQDRHSKDWHAGYAAGLRDCQKPIDTTTET